jgi:hypothetical protein
MPNTETGHFPNRYYMDAAGNIHLNGASLYLDENGSTWRPTTTVALTGSADALSPHASYAYMLNRAGVDAVVLSAPTTGTDDDISVLLISNSAFAHTITATGLLLTGTASVNVATFAAFKGASLHLRAYQGKWYVIASNGITFS